MSYIQVFGLIFFCWTNNLIAPIWNSSCILYKLLACDEFLILLEWTMRFSFTLQGEPSSACNEMEQIWNNRLECSGNVKSKSWFNSDFIKLNFGQLFWSIIPNTRSLLVLNLAGKRVISKDNLTLCIQSNVDALWIWFSYFTETSQHYIDANTREESTEAFFYVFA